MSPDATMSDAEYLVLQVLWELSSATVREIRRVLSARGQVWAPTTINTLLKRLETKQFVAADKSEFAHRFRPLVSREWLVQRRLKELADTFCDGQTTPLMLALVSGPGLSAEDVQQLRSLLDELEQQVPSPTPKAAKQSKRRRS